MQNKDKDDGIEDSPLDMLLMILLEGASKVMVVVVTPSSVLLLHHIHYMFCFDDSLLASSFSINMARLALEYCDVICSFSIHLKHVICLKFDLPLVDSLSKLLVVQIAPSLLNLSLSFHEVDDFL